MTPLATVLFGMLGGLVPDLLRFLKYKYKKNFPSYLRYATFWIGLLISLGLGALTAWLLAASTPLQAVACGFSAPEILTRILSTQPTSLDRGSARFDLREWWGL